MRIELDAHEPQPKSKLTDDEFRFIYSRVLCLCVDIVIVQNGGVLFAKRKIEPFKGLWTLPGGIVRYKEPVDEAFQRLLTAELGVKCTGKKLIGYIQHLDDGEFRSSLSLAFLTKYEGRIGGSWQGREFRPLTEFSENVQPYQAKFFQENWQNIMAESKDD